MNIMLIIWKNRGNMNNFGEIIKDIRKKNNLTQKELADKLYVTYQAVYFATKGVIKNLRGFNIFKVDNTDPFIGKYFVE